MFYCYIMLQVPEVFRQPRHALSHELIILHIPQMLLNPRSMCFLSFVCVLFLQEPQPIDWEYYRKGIGSKVVDMYKEAYESKYPLLQN